MGVDFLQKRAKPFVKGWDASRLELARKTLFTREADGLATNAVAKTVGPWKLKVGDDVLVRVEGDELLVLADLAVHAAFVKPPASIVEMIRQTGGYANGTVATAFAALNLIEVTIR